MLYKWIQSQQSTNFMGLSSNQRLMNPARSLAPVLVFGFSNNLWLYWSATFIGPYMVALMFGHHQWV
ncbi:MAG TPA: aquaporin [Nitrososphaeraceae archaeon]